MSTDFCRDPAQNHLPSAAAAQPKTVPAAKADAGAAGEFTAASTVTSAPAISVILPIYGVERELPACLQSLAAQTFTDYEAILVDDGSPDGCAKICDDWAAAHPGTRVLHQKNRGLSGARNAGIGLAKGRYLAFVDSDDLLLPDFLAKLYAACEASGADMALCGVEDVAENGDSLPVPALTCPDEGVFAGRALLPAFYAKNSGCYTVAWNKLYRAALWQNLRYPEGKIHEDDAVAHELFCACAKIACVAQPLYRYRLRGGSICHTEVRPAHFDGVEALAARYRFFAQNGISGELCQKAAAACWEQYLYLCGAAAKAPDAALCSRINSLHGLLAGVPIGGLSLRQRLSALRWSRKDAFSLCHTKNPG